MFLKFTHLDGTNKFHSFMSTKSSIDNNISIGISVTPAKKQNDYHKPQQGHHLWKKAEKVVLQSSKMGKLDGRNGLHGNPVGKLGKDGSFDLSSMVLDEKYGLSGSNIVPVENSGFQLQNNENDEVGFGRRGVHGGGVNELQNCSSSMDQRRSDTSGKYPNRGVKKNGFDFEKFHSQDSNRTKNGHVGKPDENFGNKKQSGIELSSGKSKRSAVEEVKTKCSTKWLKYGGCIPAILEALESISDLDEAFRPWEKSLSNKERSIVLKEQVLWERALEIFEWFKRKDCFEVNVIHYNIILRILGRARKWDEVQRLLDEMTERKINPINSTYGTLIDVYSKGGLRERAFEWLELMNRRGMEPDEVTMGIVVQMYKKNGEFKKAEEFFRKWSLGKCVTQRKGNARSMNGKTKSHVSLSSYTYNTLIDTYGKAGQVKEASETFALMLREGIVPTTVTFNTMIHMYGNNGRLSEVSSLIMKMKELHCPPDTRTYNILIFLHAKHDDIYTAVKYFNEMKASGLVPDPVGYRTLLYAFSMRHMVGEAETLVSEMDKRGLEIDEFTQSALTRMYIEAGLLESSWSWFQRFHLTGNMSSECYSANIDAFGERGHVIESEKVFHCCQERNLLGVLEFNVMIKAYGISKKYHEACCLFDSMEQHGVFPDRCSYNSLVQMLAGADLPEKAKNYVRKMQHAGLVDDCIPYCAVISSYVKIGNLEMAVELYEEMIRFGVQPDVVVYGVLINAFAENGSVQEAARYLDAMESSGIQINDVICNSLIKLYTKTGCLDKAQESYRMLQSFVVDPDVYSSNCMIDLYSKRSMIRQAEQVFEYLKRKQEANEFSYAMMLCMYRRNGMFVEAIRIAQKMKELGVLTELLSFNNVLSLYASDGRYKKAVETFKDMLLVSSIQPDDSTFKSLSIVLVKCGVPREAIDKLEALRKEDFERGLEAWLSTLSTVISISNNVDNGD